MRQIGAVAAALALSVGTASAEVPVVVTDIAPVHALATRVMAGVGEPSVILAPGSNPHIYAMRPSEAGRLEQADIVFWVGPELTPWLEQPLGTLAANATKIELMQAEGTDPLPFRWIGEADHDDHGDDGHDDHGDDEHGHAHEDGAPDPHIWLDPVRAAVWMQAMAGHLSEQDPENAQQYAANAEQGTAELLALSAELATQLAPLQDVGLVYTHDAFHYFEDRFGLHALGAMGSGEGEYGPRQLARLRDMTAGAQAACIILEPHAAPGIAEAVKEGSAAKVVSIDLQGYGIEPGVDFYPALMRSIAAGFQACLPE